MECNNELVVYPNKKKFIRNFIGSCIVVFLGIILIIYQRALNINAYIYILGSYFGVPFFALCAIINLQRLLQPKPTLIINSEGIDDKTKNIGVGLIKWDEIKEIFPINYVGQRYLGIVPKDLDKILNRAGITNKTGYEFNEKLAKAPIAIPEITLGMPFDEIVQYVKKYINIGSTYCPPANPRGSAGE